MTKDIETWYLLFPVFLDDHTELANLLKDSVKMDGVSLEEINLMIAMSKGLDDNGAGNDLKVRLFFTTSFIRQLS